MKKNKTKNPISSTFAKKYIFYYYGFFWAILSLFVILK